MPIFTAGNLYEAQLTSIENKIDTLLASQSDGLKFTLLTLNPIYQAYSTSGWFVSPTNLENLYDIDNNTASNLFEINGAPWAYGEIILTPSILIPGFTKIYFKVGMQAWGNQRAEWELAVFDISRSAYRNIWNYNGQASDGQDLIAEVDISVPFQWDKLRFKLIDVGIIRPRARFYDLKVWEVS